ncbi:RNA-binding protein 25-like [Leguminivora glycinivorella]|uniref:RNA-binding protein 25-like n=1 Tax=Leguminivora glycinivorella TaxID=1035111 RepID=UPI0020100013|nr:RNA-binding protein 25-like [Leguminivora glycinivorella]
MGRFAPLLIPRREWERIKNQANPETEHKTPCHVDIEAMNAQSQKWTSTWPDSSQGKINKVIKKNKKAHLEEMKELEAFYKKEKRDNVAENVRKARNMIFDRTGYGRELLSALAESKALEERDIQIKFNKDIQEKEKKIEEAKLKVDSIMYAEFEKGENDRVLKKKKEREDAECNKMIADKKMEDALRAAEMEKKSRLEEEALIEKFRQLQIAEEKHDPCIDKEADKIYEEQDKVIKEWRKKREALDQVLADLWCKYEDRIRRKEKQIFDQMHKEKHDTGHFKENFELVQRLQQEGEKKYNDFIDRGVRRLEKRLQKKEKEEIIKKEQERSMKISQAQCSELPSQQKCEEYQRKICVDKQSFLPTRRGKRDAKIASLKGSRLPPPRPQYLAPSTALQDALKHRQTLPGGWTGTKGAHEQFARHAAAALKEAVYKRPVQKVIESYCKTNNLKELQIPNL